MYVTCNFGKSVTVLTQFHIFANGLNCSNHWIQIQLIKISSKKQKIREKNRTNTNWFQMWWEGQRYSWEKIVISHQWLKSWFTKLWSMAITRPLNILLKPHTHTCTNTHTLNVSCILTALHLFGITKKTKAGGEDPPWMSYLGQISEVAGQSEVKFLWVVVGYNPGKDWVLV